jgi:hypothetical protein
MALKPTTQSNEDPTCARPPTNSDQQLLPLRFRSDTSVISTALRSRLTRTIDSRQGLEAFGRTGGTV